MIGSLFKKRVAPANTPARPKPRDVTERTTAPAPSTTARIPRERARKSEFVTLFASRLSTSVVANDRP